MLSRNGWRVYHSLAYSTVAFVLVLSDYKFCDKKKPQLDTISLEPSFSKLVRVLVYLW